MDNRLEKARQRVAELKAAGEYKVFNPLEKSKANPQSMRLAINAHCFVCMGSGDDGGWRKMIANCTSEEICPLWPQRPYQRMQDSKNES